MGDLASAAMIVVSRNQARLLSDLLERAAGDEVTYPERGQTGAGEMPAGYRHDRLSLRVGEGGLAWQRAQAAVRGWEAHRRAGIKITPSDASLQEGATVLASRRVGPLLVVAPCRIVYTTVTSTRFGFAYGTLPGHPEKGEEAFHVCIDDADQVMAEIVAFSRPAEVPTRLAGPIARQFQKLTTKRYLEGIQAYVRRGR